MSHIIDLHEFIELVAPVKLHPYQKALIQSFDLEAGGMYKRKPVIYNPQTSMCAAIAKAVAIHNEHPELRFSRESVDLAVDSMRSREKLAAFIENYGTSGRMLGTNVATQTIGAELARYGIQLGSEEDE